MRVAVADVLKAAGPNDPYLVLADRILDALQAQALQALEALGIPEKVEAMRARLNAEAPDVALNLYAYDEQTNELVFRAEIPYALGDMPLGTVRGLSLFVGPEQRHAADAIPSNTE
jgi:hypothetical protein